MKYRIIEKDYVGNDDKIYHGFFPQYKSFLLWNNYYGCEYYQINEKICSTIDEARIFIADQRIKDNVYKTEVIHSV